MDIATLGASGDGQYSSGLIRHERGKFVVMLDGMPHGRMVGSIQAAAEQLAHAVASRLPKNPRSWSARASCPAHGINVGIGLGGGGGGGGELHPCARKVLGRRRLTSLSEALAAFAQVIGHCCR